jgi:hypothetical protein
MVMARGAPVRRAMVVHRAGRGKPPAAARSIA